MAGINYIINKALLLFTFKIIVAPSLDPMDEMNEFNLSLGVIHPYFKKESILVEGLKVPDKVCELFRLNSYKDMPIRQPKSGKKVRFNQ